MYRVRPGIETEEAEIHPNLLPKVPADVVEWLVPQPIALVEDVAHRAEQRPVLFELLPKRAMLAEVMPEHAIGELAHQVAILRGASNAAGTVTIGTADGAPPLHAALDTSLSITANPPSNEAVSRSVVAVGVALDAEGAAHWRDLR